METGKVIYTNGRDVTVTESAFQVKNTLYRLNGITRHGLSILKAPRVPCIALCIIGTVLILLGLLGIFPATTDISAEETSMNANLLFALIGAGLFIIGAIILAVVRDRYAVRIVTAEGEKDVVVSRKKEYINQIVDALNEAFKRTGFDTHYVAS